MRAARWRRSASRRELTNSALHFLHFLLFFREAEEEKEGVRRDIVRCTGAERSAVAAKFTMVAVESRSNGVFEETNEEDVCHQHLPLYRTMMSKRPLLALPPSTTVYSVNPRIASDLVPQILSFCDATSLSRCSWYVEMACQNLKFRIRTNHSTTSKVCRSNGMNYRAMTVSGKYCAEKDLELARSNSFPSLIRQENCTSSHTSD